ncbi:sortase family protein [Geodermatophilus normandii]|uniref:Sortase family protein n=1 Tax=Geodermatophilus normandii TaxID=1137989 RepID=A0A317QGD5_9ACTN|nr:class F sortase [Geodermatophilus normandii]PWW21676.1 sortase family protein [Geodermatophilus normandii]
MRSVARELSGQRLPLLVFLVVLLAGAGVFVWTARPAADTAAPTPATSLGAVPATGEVPALPAAGTPADGPVVPGRIVVPAIGVDTAVESRGTVQYENPFTGRTVDGYDVPRSMRTTSWWSDGPAPGSGQMAVVLGHAGADGGAVFDRLSELSPGDEVLLVDAGGAYLRLAVLGEPVTGLDKATSALADTLNRHPADADLALVTCGGEFDEAAGASEDNTVVFARVV